MSSPARQALRGVGVGRVLVGVATLLAAGRDDVPILDFLPRPAVAAARVLAVRDLVQGLTLLLEKPAAVGEAFNLSGPAPFSFDQVVSYISEKTGRRVVDAIIDGPPVRIHHSTAKARTMLGYDPKHDVFNTIDAALATRASQLQSKGN